tara:strand:- start:997 stop:1626 length:630 start_codon:yes stop_codon:yes gene_type:complete
MSERKQKKPMTEEQLERLALARQKANEMRKINQAKRLQNKMDNLKYNPDGTLKEGTAPHAENIEEKEIKENVEEKELKEEGVKEQTDVEEKPQMTITQTTASLEGELQEEEQVIIKKKPPKKKKQVVIVEQSDDDSDEFESNQNVLFVKRVSKNKKEVKLPEPPPQPQEYAPPPRREPPIVPRKTKHELMYDNMFSGGFLNNNGFQRRF